MTAFDFGVLILRLAIGLTFAAHGAQKAFGWWRGPGPANWMKAVHGMGFHPPALFAAASIGAELVAGLMLALGFITPVAAAVLVAQSIVIAVQAHLPKGFFSTQGGFEFPFVLGAGAFATGLLGAGVWSLDVVLLVDLPASVRAVLLLVGLAGGVLTLAMRGSLNPAVRASRRGLGRAH
jgi:putative oxidoreductase